MPKINEVISHLRPGVEWVIQNDSLDELSFSDASVQPITKSEFDKGLKDYELKKSSEAQTKAAAKIALFQRLGITADEAALVLQ